MNIFINTIYCFPDNFLAISKESGIILIGSSSKIKDDSVSAGFELFQDIHDHPLSHLKDFLIGGVILLTLCEAVTRFNTCYAKGNHIHKHRTTKMHNFLVFFFIIWFLLNLFHDIVTMLMNCIFFKY